MSIATAPTPALPAMPVRRSAPASVEIEPLVPGTHRLWDEFVEEHADGSVFHATVWMGAVIAAFRHEAFHAIARRGDTPVAVLPLFLVKSRLAGPMLVSVPYGVYGGVLDADDDEAAEALMENARLIAAKLSATCIDLRSARARFSHLPTQHEHVTFRRELPDDPADVAAWLPRKARAVVRNARTKYGLTVQYSDEHLDCVWRLYCRSMRRIASINYPLRFFRELIKRTPQRHLVSIVLHNNEPIAGLVSFLYRDTVMPYFVGATEAAYRTGAVNLVYASLAERAVELGYRMFDFGRSRRDNAGCCDFKRFQGFEPTPLGYQREMMPGFDAPILSPVNPKFRMARRVWPHLPLAVTSRIGGRLAYHIPG